MKHFWKIVLILVVVLLLAGILLGGAGLLTGASPDRIFDAVTPALDGFRAVLEPLWARLTALF